MPGGGSSWEKLREIAPYEFQILRAAGRVKQKGRQTLESVKGDFANVSDYNLEAMNQIALLCREDPKEYLTHMRKACELRPDLYLTLARYLVGKQMPKEASYAYQAAFDRATDRISMANESEWIVNYYYDNGRVDDAVKIGADAAEVFSYRGLETAAKLMERMGKLDEAAKHLGDIRERYEDSGPLAAFCIRHKGDSPKFAEQFRQLTAASFPEGMKNAAIGDFTGSPADGVRVDSANENTEKAGIKVGDVVVALDGYRVQTLDQYMFVRSLTDNPKLSIILWNGTKFTEVNVNLAQRRFGNKMSTFKGGKR